MNHDSRLRAPFPRIPSHLDLGYIPAHVALAQSHTHVHASANANANANLVGNGADGLGIRRTDSPAPNPFAVPTISIPTIDTIRFVALCILWYGSSALSSNTGKVIMTSFRFPVTLTIIQFFFVAGLCIVGSRLGWTGPLRSPTRAIVQGTLPMAAFQVGGHICSSLAISRVPVSTVHTIKVHSHRVYRTNG
jgi:solute carrier family 35 protein E1